MQKKKVLFLITKSNWGGAQRYVYDLATALPADRYDVSVALGGGGDLQTKLESAGLRTIPLSQMSNTLSPKKLHDVIHETTQLLRTEKPHIIHSNSSIAGFAGVIAGKKTRVPKVIFTAHGWAFNEDRPVWQKYIFKFFHWITVLQSDQTIAVSHQLKQQMNWFNAQDKMTVVHNGRTLPTYVDKNTAREFLCRKQPALERFKDDIWTGTIGELHPIKGHEIAINAVAELVQHGKTIRHIIVGSGKLRTELQSLIESKNLSEHVFLVGHIDEAAQYLKAFDIFTLTSHSEALAYVVIEAAQAALPIIATRVGGIPEVITDQQEGLLVPANDSHAVAQALTLLISDPEARTSYAQAAKQKSQQFTLGSMVEKTIAVYESN